MKKLADLTTLEGIRVLGRLTKEFNAIATDQNFKDTCADFAEKSNSMTMFEQFGVFADLLLNDYPQTVINILATIQNKTADEISKQPIITTIQQFKLLSEDKDLINFFTSFTQKAHKK